MDFLKPAKFFLTLSVLLTAASLGLVLFYGPKLSIEFTGGTRMEVAFENPDVTRMDVEQAVRGFDQDLSAGVNATGEGKYLIRTRPLDDDTHRSLLTHMEGILGSLQVDQHTTIGPTVGESLQRRAVWALIAASIGIILYLTWAFRTVPRSLSPWKFGVIAVITLLHDILFTVGIFSILSHVTSFEVDTLFVTALLTILGYSVNDTIIVFDRIRDNLTEQHGSDLRTVASQSVSQSITRSLYTSISTLVMLLALYLLGSESIRWFVLALMIGIGFGTYSSIFVATPLLVYWKKRG